MVKKLTEWCNNGAPYELRFYNVDKNHMKKLVDTLIAGGDYGSQLIPVQTLKFWRLNVTYKKTAYAMWHQIDDIAIAIGWPLSTPCSMSGRCGSHPTVRACRKPTKSRR